MKRVSFSKPIELFSGRIGLTNAQAQVRSRSLKPVGNGVYEITGKIEFKTGEPVELESIPKSLAMSVIKKSKAKKEYDQGKE